MKFENYTLPEYFVNVREVHIQPYRVEAASPEEAIKIVNGGGGDIVEEGMEYSHTLDDEYWTVDEVNTSIIQGD